MKLSKQALLLVVLILSNALDLIKARDILKTLRGKKDDSIVEQVISKPALPLMAKISSILSSCEGCDETASPSPHRVSHGGNPSSSNSGPTEGKLEPQGKSSSGSFQERSLRPPELNNDSLFGWRCAMSEGVAVVSAPGISNYQGRVFLFVDGELEKEIAPNNGKTYLGTFGLAIDEYIVACALDAVEVYDREGDYKRSIDFDSHNIVTAGDLVAGYVTADNWKIQVHKIPTGAKVYEIDIDIWPRMAMTTEYLAFSQNEKIKIYSIESNSVATRLTLVGEISFPDIEGRFLLMDIHGDRIAVVYHSKDSGGFGAIYDTTGALEVSLEIDNTDDNFKQYFADPEWSAARLLALNDKYVIVGAPHESVNSAGGAVYVFDAATGKVLEKKRSLNPEKNDFYGDCVALSGNYMIATSPAGSTSDATMDAYFQSVLSTSNAIYTNSNSGIDEIITAEY